MISVIPPPCGREHTKKMGLKRTKTVDRVSNGGVGNGVRGQRFDPYLSLANPTPYTDALCRNLARGVVGKSYAAISALRDNMHNVEHQSRGSVERIYMCGTSANCFRDGCMVHPIKRMMREAS